MRPIIRTAEDAIMKEVILQTINNEYALKELDLYRRCKSPRYVFPRQLVWYLLRWHTQYHETDIAFISGCWHRSAVIKGIRVIEERLSVEKELQKLLHQLTQKIISRYESFTPQCGHVLSA